VGGQRDGGGGPADMLLAVHVAVWGGAYCACSLSSKFLLSDPHRVCRANSTTWACWCMHAGFVRPADRVIKAQSTSYARVWPLFLCVLVF